MKKAFAFAALILIGVSAFIAGRWYVDNRYPAFDERVELYVYPHMTAEDVAVQIDTVCKLRFPNSVRRCFAKEDLDASIKPGHYVIEKGKPAIYVSRMLSHGWQTPVNLTLSGTIRSKERLSRMISNQMMLDSATVAAALNDDAFLSRYDFSSRKLFCYLLPDTYEVYWTDGVDEIFSLFRREYDAFWDSTRTQKASRMGLSREQVSVMASIVAGETRAEQEFSRVAGVYMNRYNKGMKLQADPTICYIYDYKINRVLKRHLTVDSPYNTYKYVGLPPTPINIPGKKYIDSVLDFEPHDYIYFCADPAFNGTHRFAVSYDQHLKNAREYSKALNVYLKNKGK